MAILALFLSSEVVAQRTQPNSANFERFINQVYVAEGASQITPSTRRYTYMQTLYNDRISYVVYEAEKLRALNYTKLSQVALFDTYNKGLTRDASFNPETFNPFKYWFDYYSKERQYIHVDNTLIVIVIEPQS